MDYVQSCMCKHDCTSLCVRVLDGAYLLDSLRCEDGGDGAPLLDHHSLLMAGIDGLAVQVAGCGLSVRLQKQTTESKARSRPVEIGGWAHETPRLQRRCSPPV